MAKRARLLSSWIEVAPTLFIFPKKPSNPPRLETITEEESDISDHEICSENTVDE
ncbi:hypothetical protein PHJA_000459200 [Phtheirospermum japonicum]|uniref:Uncharacterized protein n=1 Tax=Phtheirospermum japonicum TaxID=374723 RepID=A0A830BDG0_9LAMI|nr:hypothetical protein PHJA_000459200 [Phtheirospermum japonicum]